MKKYNQHLIYPIILITCTVLLLFLSTPRGMLFGSGGDWYNQHVAIAQQFRQMFYETGNLFGQYSSLGSGSSIYDFAYYGYLRPDILFSLLVPGLEMKYIIIGYALLGIFSSVLLCYHWLKKQELAPSFCAMGSILLLCGGCFIQARRQIMFINYMPFLLLALLGIDHYLKHRKKALLTAALFFIYLHSFYFAISCLLICFIYFLYKSKKPRPLWGFITSVTISIGMAAILLIPVGINLLSNKKDAGNPTAWNDILSIDLSMAGFLYTAYGCGLTLLTLYCLLLSIVRKQTRALALTLLLCFLFPLVLYVLNGTLYIRTKIMIPFLPLLVLLGAKTLEGLYRKWAKPLLLPALLCLIPALFSVWRAAILFDGAILILFVLVLKWVNSKQNWSLKAVTAAKTALYLAALSLPATLSIMVSLKMGHLPADDRRQANFSTAELESLCQDDRYRFDCLSDNLVNSNCLVNGGIQRTSMYSSTTNSLYAEFFYDIIKNPISIRNRVALLPNSNSFFAYLMGVRYIQTNADKIPYGYQVVKQKGKLALAENKNVLPIAYGTNKLLSQTAFDQLSYPDNLEALTQMTITKDASETAFSSHMKAENPQTFFAAPASLTTQLKKSQTAAGITIKAVKDTTLTLPLRTPSNGKLLLLSFDIESPGNREVSISVNKITNKLSGSNAPYPNHNNTFTYIISANEDITELNVKLTKGEYQIKNLTLFSLDTSWLEHPDITAFDFEETKSDMVINGTIDLPDSGYLVTSIPHRPGYQAFVDNREVDVEIVNKAFVGLPLSAGQHRVTLLYHAPGRSLGTVLTVVSIIYFLVLILTERRHIK